MLGGTLSFERVGSKSAERKPEPRWKDTGLREVGIPYQSPSRGRFHFPMRPQYTAGFSEKTPHSYNSLPFISFWNQTNSSRILFLETSFLRLRQVGAPRVCSHSTSWILIAMYSCYLLLWRAKCLVYRVILLSQSGKKKGKWQSRVSALHLHGHVVEGAGRF